MKVVCLTSMAPPYYHRQPLQGWDSLPCGGVCLGRSGWFRALEHLGFAAQRTTLTLPGQSAFPQDPEAGETTVSFASSQSVQSSLLQEGGGQRKVEGKEGRRKKGGKKVGQDKTKQKKKRENLFPSSPLGIPSQWSSAGLASGSLTLCRFWIYISSKLVVCRTGETNQNPS